MVTPAAKPKVVRVARDRRSLDVVVGKNHAAAMHQATNMTAENSDIRRPKQLNSIAITLWAGIAMLALVFVMMMGLIIRGAMTDKPEAPSVSRVQFFQ